MTWLQALDSQSRIALGVGLLGLAMLVMTLLGRRSAASASGAPAGPSRPRGPPKPGLVLQLVVSLAAPALVGPAMWHATKAQAVSSVLALLAMVMARLALKTLYGLGSRLRSRRMEQGIVAMLELMVLCAEAGLGPDGAIERVARELVAVHPELAVELGRLSHDLSLLPDRLAAYRAMGTRAPAPGMAVVATALERTEHYGTPLLPVLQTLLQDARLREAQRVESIAQRMPVYLIMTLVVLFIPAIMIILVGPSYLRLINVLRDVARQAATQ